MMSMKFAKKVLSAIAIIHIIGGILLPLLALTSLTEPYFQYLTSKFPASNQDSLKFLFGVFGPTIASWGILFFAFIQKAFQTKQKQDWYYLISAILVWGLLDSGFSVYFGIHWHLILNSSIMLLILTILLIVKKHFK